MADDQELRKLLKEWEVSGAPESLDGRVAKLRRHSSMTLLTGSIRVPIPVVVAMACALFAMAAALLRRPAAEAPVVPSISLTDFHPVSDLNVRVIRSHETN